MKFFITRYTVLKIFSLSCAAAFVFVFYSANAQAESNENKIIKNDSTHEVPATDTAAESVTASSDFIANCLIKAKKESESKNYLKAISIYSKILELKPDHGDALTAIGQNYLWAKNFKKAIKAFKMAIEISPRDLDARIGLGNARFFNKQLSESDAIFGSIEREYPHDRYALMAAACYYGWRLKLNRAAKLYKKLISKDEKDNQARLELAKIFFWDKKYDQALNICKESLKYPGADTRSIDIQMAFIYISLKKNDNALKICNKLLKINKNDKTAHDILKSISQSYLQDIEILYNEKKYIKAAALADKTLLKLPNCFQANKYGAISYYLLGEYEISLKYALNYERLCGGDSEAISLIADIYAKLNSAEKAASYNEKLIKLAPEREAELNCASAKIYFEAKKHEKAFEIIDRVINKNKTYYPANILRARFSLETSDFENLKKYEKCVAQYRLKDETAAAIYSKIIKYHIEKGGQLMKNKQYSAASLYYENIIKRIGNDYDLLMCEGEANSRVRNYEKAIDCYKKALYLNEKSTDAKLYIALNYSWMGKYNEAIRLYESILAGDPKCSDAACGIARTNFWAERFYESLKYYEKAYSMNPKDPEIIAGYANMLHIFGSDREAAIKISEALTQKSDYDYASALKDSIEKLHRSEFSAFSSRAKDSDLANLISKGGDISLDINLNTRLKTSYRQYDIYNDNGGTAHAKTSVFSVKSQFSPLIKIYASIGLYELQNPLENFDSKTGFGFAAAYSKPNNQSFILSYDKSPLFENSSLVRNKISVSTATLEYQKTHSKSLKSNMEFSTADFSDGNRRNHQYIGLNYTKNFERIKLVAGPRYKLMKFQKRKYNGYFSPEKYESAGLECTLAYASNDRRLSLEINEEYGRQREYLKETQNYHKSKIDFSYKLKEYFELFASFLKTDSGFNQSLDRAPDAGYWYRQTNLGLKYLW